MKLLTIFGLLCFWFSEAKAQFQTSVLKAQAAACCCGQFEEIFFPNLDFESPPSPAPGTFITYGVGQTFGGWTVTRATIDHCDALVGNLAAGNPNGPSFFIDLHGSPGLGAISYDLYGLKPGSQYRIDFWTAQNGGGFSSTGTLKIANGAWLNVDWTVSQSGAVAWFKESYQFMALASTATMEFSSVGPMPFQGTLIDDIHIFECPGDTEKPVVTNPPDNVEVECDKDVPKAPKLIATDNCDPNPLITLKEITQIIDPCTKKITRSWEIKDACGNIATEDQIIDVIDKNPPQFTKLPDDKLFNCDKDILKEFNDWIKKNGNAIAVDACGAVSWRADYDRLPKKYCDTILVDFIATDHCGNESSEFAHFIVRDTSPPRFIVKAENKNFVCIPGTKDSLRNWLSTYGFSKTLTDCDTVILSSNFNGDSTKNPLQLTFYAKDRCGNIDSCSASFTYRSNSDTFRITNFSCTYSDNSIDTMTYIVNGCDSIVILRKIKIKSDSTYIQLNTCNPQQKTFDTLKLVNRSGCDSLIFNEYVLQPKPITTIQKMDCAYTQFSRDTMVRQGQYCDSLIVTEHIPLRKDSSLVIRNTCDKTKADTSILPLKNNVGCDSIVTIYTVYTAQQMTFIDKKVCGLAKNFIDTLIIKTGLCDSLVITTYTSLPLDTAHIQTATCDKSKAGIFSNKLTNQFGCDSLVIHEIRLNPSDSIFISKSTCVRSQSGISIVQLKNKFGCDSIVQTTTNFIPSDTIHFQQTTCLASQAKTDTLIFKTNTCDSLVYRRIVFLPSDTTVVSQTTCNLSNARSDTLIYTTNTCDSVVFRNVVFIPADTTRISKTTCDPAMAGSDTLVFTTNTCDSVVFRNIQLLLSDTTHITQTTCNPVTAGLSTNVLQNSKGCDSTILINTNYVPLLLDFQLDSISCFNQNDGTFKIINTSDFSKPIELILNNTKLGNLNQINNLGPGSYEIIVRDQKGCITDSVKFSLTNPQELIIDLGTDLEVKKGSKINLNLQSNRILQNIFWSPSTLSNCTNCNQINFVVDQDTWVYAQAIDQRNCIQTDSILIRVKKSGSVYAPNSFSPNGDNINDYFYIQGDENAIVETLFIYNRWGEKVFETQNVPVNLPTAGWNGTFNGEKMDPGVFVYYAKVKISNDEFIELIGNITLIR